MKKSGKHKQQSAFLCELCTYWSSRGDRCDMCYEPRPDPGAARAAQLSLKASRANDARQRGSLSGAGRGKRARPTTWSCTNTECAGITFESEMEANVRREGVVGGTSVVVCVVCGEREAWARADADVKRGGVPYILAGPSVGELVCVWGGGRL